MLSGCGGASRVGGSPTTENSFSRGFVAVYEARIVTPVGTSLRLVERPIRRAEVALRSAAGVVLERTKTREDGSFAFSDHAGGHEVVLWSVSPGDGADRLSVTLDEDGRQPHTWRVLASRIQGGRIVVRDADGVSGAFHILDTLVRGRDAVRGWLGIEFPELFAYWARGETESWSYYHGEVSEGGRFAIELLSGKEGDRRTQDTDEYDASIILHEYGHFVMDQISTDSSPGGSHPPGFLVNPGLAFEEGRASWFSALVLGQPWYLDTIGREPIGRLRVGHHLERGEAGPRGPGSEQEVAEVLWDLTDGSDGFADQDDDGIALSPGTLLSAMAMLRETPGLYPSLSAFLQQLCANGDTDQDAVGALLERGGYPPEMLLESWPPLLKMGEPAVGSIDGVSQPAPSGGPNRPDTGVDAVQVFRFEVGRPSLVRLSLRIGGSGRVRDREDLDLEIRTIRADLIARAATEAQTEALEQTLEPGWYVVYVRDGGAGNRAGFELNMTLVPSGPEE